MHWPSEILATAAGVLRQHHSGVSTYEILTTVWTVASREEPAIGGLRLLHRSREELLRGPAKSKAPGLPASRFLLREPPLSCARSARRQIGKE